MKKLFLLIFATSLLGCNGQLDKTIFEPMTVSELKKSIDNDSLFKNTYEYIQFVRDTILKSDISKAKFANLTYRKVHEFVQFSNDTNYFKPINERIKVEWERKYGKYLSKVDSISSYWKKIKAENSLEQYVKVELIEIEKEYYNSIGEIKNINLSFRLTPLKGRIDQVRFGYKIEEKINEENKTNSLYSALSPLGKTWYLTTDPFSKPVVRYWEANYSDEKILANKTIETLFRDYNVHIEVDEIRKDGKNMSDDNLNIPKSVSKHWEYEHDEYLKELYVKDIVKELLNKQYVYKYEYRSQEVDKILKEKDELLFEFLKLPETRK